MTVDKGGAGFWLSAAAGWLIIAAGLRGIVLNSIDTRPGNLARFVVGGALLHDLIVAPLVIVIAVVVGRAVPGRARAVVQGALVVSAVVALFSYPLVGPTGWPPTIPRRSPATTPPTCWWSWVWCGRRRRPWPWPGCGLRPGRRNSPSSL